MRLKKTDQRLIYFLQGDLPVVSRPFDWLAKQLGLEEEEVIARISALKEKGVIRRFGATLYHQRSGYPANVMVAWQVPEARVEEVGRALAKVREVTHCYQRLTGPNWPYNLYCMIHGPSEEACARMVARLAEETKVPDYRLLFSREELKKISMRYFQ